MVQTTITKSQAQPYVTDFKAADPNGDGSLDQTEFSAACKNGLVKGTASTGAATGEPSDKMAPAEKIAPRRQILTPAYVSPLTQRSGPSG